MSLFSLTIPQLILFVLCAALVGFSKTSMTNLSMLSIVVLAGLFGGRTSTGVVLILLIMGDLFAVKHYTKHCDWSQLKYLLPWAFVGIAIGLLVGGFVTDAQFKIIIAILVLFSLGLMVLRERRGNRVSLPDSAWLSALVGLACGFATMIGNIAGPILGLYLLAKHLPKYVFVGTSAWFYAIVNVAKIPLHLFVWRTLTWNTLALDALAAPALALGALAGVWLLAKIPEKIFRHLIMVLTTLAAIKLLF